MIPMLTLKEFMNEMILREEYNGQKIIEREIGYGAKPDVYLFYGDTKSSTRFYSCFEEYENYKEAHKKFAEWMAK